MSNKPYSKISKRQAKHHFDHPPYPADDSHFEPIRVSMDADPTLIIDNASTESRPLKDLLTVAEAAKVMNVSITSIQRLQHSRQLPYFKIGRAVRIAYTDIQIYLKSRKRGSVD